MQRDSSTCASSGLSAIEADSFRIKAKSSVVKPPSRCHTTRAGTPDEPGNCSLISRSATTEGLSASRLGALFRSISLTGGSSTVNITASTIQMISVTQRDFGPITRPLHFSGIITVLHFTSITFWFTINLLINLIIYTQRLINQP